MKRAFCIALPSALVLIGACSASTATFGDFDTHARDGSVLRERDGSSGATLPGDAEADAYLDASSSSSGSSSGSGGADAGPDSGAFEPGLCRVADAYGLSLPIPGLEVVHTALAFSITPDERVVAWLEAGEALTAASVYTASRDSESAAFGTPTAVLVDSGAYPGSAGIALSADALHLAFTSVDGKSLGEVARPSRELAFGSEVARADYLSIEPEIDDAEAKLTAPVFGMQDHMLAIARRRASAPDYSVLVAERDGLASPWPLPSARTEAVLAVNETGSAQPKTVTGISVDGLTFFVRNDVTGGLFAVNRPNLGATFETSYKRALAAATAAMPNADCARVYVLESGSLLVRTRIQE